MDPHFDNGISLKEFLQKHKLPQIVRVVSGMYDVADEMSLAREEILTLHSLNKYETVKSTDEEGHTFYLPLNVTSRVAIVSETSWRQTYVDVESLSDEFPSLVISAQEHADLGIHKGDILKLIHTLYSGPREGFLQCALVNRPQQDDIFIPLAYTAMFETVESSDQNSLYLKEVVTNYMLPIDVKFLEDRLTIQKSDVNFCRPTSVAKLGHITLHGQSDINIVIATTKGQDNRTNHHSLISIPDDLDIRVVPVETANRRRAKCLLELDFCDISFVYGSAIITESPVPSFGNDVESSTQDIPPPLPPRICVAPYDKCNCDSCHGNIKSTEDSGSDDCHGNGSHDNATKHVQTTKEGRDGDCSDDVCHSNSSHDNSLHDNNTTDALVTRNVCSYDDCHGSSSDSNALPNATVITSSSEIHRVALSVDCVDCVSHDNGCHSNEDSVLKSSSSEKILTDTFEAKSDGGTNVGAHLENENQENLENRIKSGSAALVTRHQGDESKPISQEKTTVVEETIENQNLDLNELQAGLAIDKTPSLNKLQGCCVDQSSGLSDSLQEETSERISGQLLSTNNIDNSVSDSSIEPKPFTSSFSHGSSNYHEIRELVKGKNTAASNDSSNDNHLEMDPSLNSSRARYNTLPALFHRRKPNSTTNHPLKKLTNFARSLKRSQSTTDVSGYSYDAVSNANRANKETKISSWRRGLGNKPQQSRTRWYV